VKVTFPKYGYGCDKLFLSKSKTNTPSLEKSLFLAIEKLTLELLSMQEGDKIASQSSAAKKASLLSGSPYQLIETSEEYPLKVLVAAVVLLFTNKVQYTGSLNVAEKFKTESVIKLMDDLFIANGFTIMNDGDGQILGPTLSFLSDVHDKKNEKEHKIISNYFIA
jgi:hypothetical protein